MKKMCLMVVAAVAACGVRADVKLAAPFNDGMVLQREKPVAVWGTAAAGEKVTVAFAGQSGPPSDSSARRRTADSCRRPSSGGTASRCWRDALRSIRS